MKTTRKFNGKTYMLFDWASTRREATKEANELRREGWRVRVVPAGEGYHIWRRK